MAIEKNEAQGTPEVQPGAEEYEYLLDDYTHFAPPAEGEVLQGKILKVTAKDVIVDFGYKSEGLVPVGAVPLAGGRSHRAEWAIWSTS